MFNLTKPEPSSLNNEIERLLQHMSTTPPDSDEYAKISSQLEKLTKLKPQKREPVSHDAVLAVVGNLAGIFAILTYEKANVITSKAFGFVGKSRV
jgi:hypothetical protein